MRDVVRDFGGQRAPADLQKEIGYTFRDSGLLERALTHSSFCNENPPPASDGDNERLEFLGDAVLALVVADVLFQRRPRLDEGELSRLRSVLVSASNLARHAADIGLGAYMRLGRGEEKSGGRSKPALLVNAFEALVGAIYLDSDLAGATRVLLQFLDGDIGAHPGGGPPVSDFKSALQEAAQARGEGVAYQIVEETGPDHRKRFRVELLVGGDVVSSGTGLTKKGAEQAAAKRALETMKWERSSGRDDPQTPRARWGQKP